jgi:hypothetical protein
MKVKLTRDLTTYLPGLVAGTEGFATELHTSGCDRFVPVTFPNIGSLCVLWESLEIIDKEYLEKLEEADLRLAMDLKTAKNVKWVTGPRGGFKYLHYEYLDSKTSPPTPVNASCGLRRRAEEIREMIEENGIPIISLVTK